MASSLTASVSRSKQGSKYMAHYVRVLAKPFMLQDVTEVCLKDLLPGSLGSFASTTLQECLQAFLNKNYEEALEAAGVLLDYTWEKFNVGHWKDVRVVWRKAYYIASYIKVMSICAGAGGAGEASSAVSFSWSPEPAIHAADMGLLMGAPVAIKGKENILSECVAVLHRSYSRKMAGKESRVVNPVQYQYSESAQLSQDGTNHEVPPPCKQLRLDPLLSLPPLGGAPTGKAIPRLFCPSIVEFDRLHFQPGLPVVLEGCMSHWPAMSTRQWTVPYIKAAAGLRTVPVELGSRYTDESWSQTLMTVGEFIAQHVEGKSGHNNSEATSSPVVGYLAQHPLFDQIPELRGDIVVPTYCALGDKPLEDADVNAWFGPAGTTSPLHHDPKHNFLSQVLGRKRVRVYAPKETDRVYPHEKNAMFSNTSRVDVEAVDEEEFPEFLKAEWVECVLHPGDMLYMPPKWWHFVKSLSVSFSVSFWWE